VGRWARRRRRTRSTRVQAASPCIEAATLRAPGVSDLPLRDRMLLGRSDMGLQDAVMLLRSLAPAWPSSDYDLLDRNCHHWSECAAEALGVCEALPRWVDRTAHCLGHLRGVPDSDTGGRGSSKVAPAVRDRGDSGGFCTMAAGYTRNHKRSDTDLTSLGEGECECEPLMGLPDGQRESRRSLTGVLGGDAAT
jgi:hypothetical protein